MRSRKKTWSEQLVIWRRGNPLLNRFLLAENGCNLGCSARNYLSKLEEKSTCQWYATKDKALHKRAAITPPVRPATPALGHGAVMSRAERGGTRRIYVVLAQYEHLDKRPPCSSSSAS